MNLMHSTSVRAGVVVISTVASVLLAVGSSAASAQPAGPGTMTKQTLTLDGANAMVAAAVAHSKALGIPSTIAVYDEGEILKALVTMDGARFTGVSFAMDKAYTAVRRKASTQDLSDAFASVPESMLLSFLKQPRLTLLGGGSPVIVDGQVIGGIGSSGGTIPQDIEITNAGLAAFQP